MKGNTMLLPIITLQKSRTTIVSSISYWRTLVAGVVHNESIRFISNPSRVQEESNTGGFKHLTKHEDQTDKDNNISPSPKIGEEEKTAAITPIAHIQDQIDKIRDEIANLRKEVKKYQGVD